MTGRASCIILRCISGHLLLTRIRNPRDKRFRHLYCSLSSWRCVRSLALWPLFMLCEIFHGGYIFYAVTYSLC